MLIIVYFIFMANVFSVQALEQSKMNFIRLFLITSRQRRDKFLTVSVHMDKNPQSQCSMSAFAASP